MHSCGESALTVCARATASLSRCSLRGNGCAAGGPSISVKASGSVALQHSSVLDARGVGVMLAEGASGRIEHCSILRAAKAGVAVRAAASFSLNHCTVADGAGAGVLLVQGGEGDVAPSMGS